MVIITAGSNSNVNDHGLGTLLDGVTPVENIFPTLSLMFVIHHYNIPAVITGSIITTGSLPAAFLLGEREYRGSSLRNDTFLKQ